MKTRIIFFLFVCSFFGLTGCDRDSQDEPERTVSINFTVGSMLKSAATTAEDRVDKIILYTVDNQNVVKKYETTLSGTTLTISKKVKTFYAIANPTAAMETLTTLNELLNLTCDFATVPQPPFVMSGRSDFSGSSNINIQLNRMVAKINIVAPVDFQVESLKVTTHISGYVFARTPFDVPAFSSAVIYTFTNISSPVYLAENSGQSNLTEIAITGKYRDIHSITHTFNIKEKSQDVNIVRNTSYNVELDFKYMD